MRNEKQATRNVKLRAFPSTWFYIKIKSKIEDITAENSFRAVVWLPSAQAARVKYLPSLKPVTRLRGPVWGSLIESRVEIAWPIAFIHGRDQLSQFVMHETRSVESMTSVRLEESMNIFIMQLDNQIRAFDTFSRFFFMHCLCFALWITDFAEFTITTFKWRWWEDPGRFQMDTYLYGTWSFIWALYT